MSDHYLYVECECRSPEHVIRLNYDDYYGDLSIFTQMNHDRPWWKRVWVGIKYMFGKGNKDWHCTDTMIWNDETTKLIKFLEECRDKGKILEKDKAASNMAYSQGKMDAATQTVYRILSSNENKENESIKLLIINEETTVSGVIPVCFPTNEDTPYPTCYIEIHPEEFDNITESEEWPVDWIIGKVLYTSKTSEEILKEIK